MLPHRELNVRCWLVADLFEPSRTRLLCPRNRTSVGGLHQRKTQGHCTGGVGFQINKGHCQGVRAQQSLMRFQTQEILKIVEALIDLHS